MQNNKIIVDNFYLTRDTKILISQYKLGKCKDGREFDCEASTSQFWVNNGEPSIFLSPIFMLHKL